MAEATANKSSPEVVRIPGKVKERKETRVAVYARVSAESDGATHSLEEQRAHYENYIKQRPNFVLVDIYADGGLSGTLDDRPDLNRLMSDCRDGKIDLIITKSISRFARNATLLLKMLNELEKLNVRVFFENECMFAHDVHNKIFFNLLALFAELSARGASENQLWRIFELYREGKVAGGHTYGYRIKNNQFVIEPKEAKVILKIFDLYESGLGYEKIAATLSEQEIPSPLGGKWGATTIRDILTDEKYMGDLTLQKYFRRDYLTKKVVKNDGQRAMFKAHAAHEPIIEPERFAAVQAEIKKRGARQAEIMARRAATPAEERLFTGMVFCDKCGSRYVWKRPNKAKSNDPFLVCQRFLKYGKDDCPSQKIPEKILIEKTAEMIGEKALKQGKLREKIDSIRVPEQFHLVYVLKDGKRVNVYWKHKSRSESWTKEMRKNAREKTINNLKKENSYGVCRSN